MERKEAIEIIKKNWPDSSFTMLREALESLILELKESEDEKIRKGLVAIITDFESLYLQENYSLSREDTLAWLEKQGEQKPAEWSKEDEVMIKVLDSVIRYIVEVLDKDTLERFGTKREELFSWLESIKERVQPQPQWKPSDEQMVSITCAVRKMKESACYDSELVSLYQDLKKL